MLLLFLQLLLLLLLYYVPSSSMFSAHAHINGSRFRSQSSATAADENQRRRRLLHRAPLVLVTLAPPRLFLFELLKAAKAKLFTREKISYKPNLLRLKLIFATRTKGGLSVDVIQGIEGLLISLYHTTTKCKESSVIVLDV